LLEAREGGRDFCTWECIRSKGAIGLAALLCGLVVGPSTWLTLSSISRIWFLLARWPTSSFPLVGPIFCYQCGRVEYLSQLHICIYGIMYVSPTSSSQSRSQVTHRINQQELLVSTASGSILCWKILCPYVGLVRSPADLLMSTKKNIDFSLVSIRLYGYTIYIYTI
jgi:hypothetical protein